MSVNTKVRGIMSDTNPEYQKHLKVFIACEEAGVKVPDETMRFFNYEHPKFSLQVDLKSEQWEDDCCCGEIINLKDIPPGIEKLKFEVCF